MDTEPLDHDLSEYRGTLMYDGKVGKEIGSGTVACVRCGLVLPTVNGQVADSWKEFINGIDCAEYLVDKIHLR